MKRAECSVGMIVRDIRNGATYKVIGERGVTPDGLATATDCGAWVEETEVNTDGVKEIWVIHWSHLEQVTE